MKHRGMIICSKAYNVRVRPYESDHNQRRIYEDEVPRPDPLFLEALQNRGTKPYVWYNYFKKRNA